MKKEVEISLIIVIVLLIIGIVLGFINYSNNSNKKLNDLEKKIVEYQDKIKELEIIKDKNNDEQNVKYEYNCNFTNTYRLVNMLKDYTSEVKEYSYIVVDQYQSHYAETLRIPSSLKEGLKENKWYEVTYSIKGISEEIIDIEYVMNHVSLGENSGLNVTMKIKETNKTGVEQINQNVCTYERVITE